jgi:hypothetical protein
LCRQKTRDEEDRRRREAEAAAMRAEVERLEREAAARREEERKRRAALVEEVAAWRQAAEIRAYVAAVKARLSESGLEESAEFREWEQWSTRVASEMDPLVTRAETCTAQPEIGPDITHLR